MGSAIAWLLECSDNLTIAVGEHELAEIYKPDRSFPVPGTPQYCSRVINWRNQLIPVMLLPELTRQCANPMAEMMAILAYQSEPGVPLQYVAVPVQRTPKRNNVGDDLQSDLPEEFAVSVLQDLVLSSIEWDGKAVAILNIAYLCSASFRESVDNGGLNKERRLIECQPETSEEDTDDSYDNINDAVSFS